MECGTQGLIRVSGPLTRSNAESLADAAEALYGSSGYAGKLLRKVLIHSSNRKKRRLKELQRQ
jgi:hypothetical protein